MTFAAAAAELRRQEIARLARYVTPPVEALRSLTPGPFREIIAAMVERLGHTVINNPTTATDIVTVKDGKKFLIACAVPSDPAPTVTREVARLHDAIVNANASRGIYVTTRTFAADAKEYAKGAPIDLVDGAVLAKSLEASNAGVTLPSQYRAMCHICGAIVEHCLDKTEALPCVNDHLVAPTIARAALSPPRRPQPSATAQKQGRDMSPKAQRRREVRAHNHRVRARAIKQQRGGR